MKVKVPTIPRSRDAAMLEMSWGTREINPSLPFWNIKQVTESSISQPASPSHGSCIATSLIFPPALPVMPCPTTCI